MFTHSVHQGLRAPDEHAAVPVVVAGGYELFRFFGVRLFREAAYPQDARLVWVAGLDVSITGLSPRGLYAHHDNILPRSSDLYGEFQISAKLLLISDHVVRREHSDHSARIIAIKQERCEPDRGRRIT